MYRQGDVLLIPVKTIPEGAKAGKLDAGRIVLAYGEVTGHCHQIRRRTVGLFEHEGTRFVRVPKEGAELEHEEHGAIKLAAGEYQVRIQKEFSPQYVRNVLD